MKLTRITESQFLQQILDLACTESGDVRRMGVPEQVLLHLTGTTRQAVGGPIMSEQSTRAHNSEQEQVQRLVFLRKCERSGYSIYRCTCGITKEVRDAHVNAGATRSCGCLGRELSRKRKTTHGQYRTVEAAAWRRMIARCHNPKARDYRRYGGRGIEVCKEWRKSCQAFIDEVGRRPSSEHSIDRIDNSRGYEPGNCRWATRVQQGRNKRNNVLLTHNGETKTVAEWAEITGIGLTTILFRIRKSGFSVERALTERVGRWARLRCDACLECGSSFRKHHAKGYCGVCYYKRFGQEQGAD